MHFQTAFSILDQVHVMNYDYHGSWETYTGMNAPLYANPNYDLTMDNQFLNAVSLVLIHQHLLIRAI